MTLYYILLTWSVTVMVAVLFFYKTENLQKYTHLIIEHLEDRIEKLKIK